MPKSIIQQMSYIFTYILLIILQLPYDYLLKVSTVTLSFPYNTSVRCKRRIQLTQAKTVWARLGMVVSFTARRFAFYIIQN